jgi:hypothetical protein
LRQREPGRQRAANSATKRNGTAIANGKPTARAVDIFSGSPATRVFDHGTGGSVVKK